MKKAFYLLATTAIVLCYTSVHAQIDTCNLPFVATVSNPVCSGKDAQLSVTLYPNTTYTWSKPGVNPVYSPSVNNRTPSILNLTAAHSGTYTVVGTRGVCNYQATVNVTVNPTPSVGNVLQTGPVCPGENDSINLPNVNVPLGGNVIAFGSFPGSPVVFNPNGYFLAKNNVMPADAGTYFVYAVNNGCFSDTVAFDFKVHQGVTADFDFDLTEGCNEDKVVFTNTSTGQTKNSWNFGDNTNGTDWSPIHSYVVPKPNNASRTYAVKLVASNAFCADSITQNVIINHPITSVFTIDDDSICEGTEITFTNSSVVKPGTGINVQWDFKDGNTDNTYDTKHVFDKPGIYHPELTVTDFLGCVEKQTVELVVDPNGYISFVTDKDEVCVGDGITLNGDYNDWGVLSVNWDLKDGADVNGTDKEVFHSYLNEGIYTVSYSVDYRICPDLNFEKDITVKPLPEVFIGNDTTICPNSTPIRLRNILDANNPSAITYKWNNITRDVADNITVRSPGIYAVTAEMDGCVASDSLKVSRSCYINIPNAFTPNGDGRGDYFLPHQILSRNVNKFEMNIFNRWGERVFATNNVDGRGWDGKYGGENQPVGVYIYTISVEFENGVYEKYKGNVSLLR